MHVDVCVCEGSSQIFILSQLNARMEFAPSLSLSVARASIKWESLFLPLPSALDNKKDIKWHFKWRNVLIEYASSTNDSITIGKDEIPCMKFEIQILRKRERTKKNYI
jgi:hypothetical protein